MATAGGRGPDHLNDDLAGGTDGPRSVVAAGVLAEGWRYTFFQAVRLLQLDARERVPVGTGDDPSREAVRFTSRVSLAFPAGDLYDVQEVADQARVTVAFMGVATPASFGSLPMPYSELVLAQQRDKQPALRDFFDLFNHRLVSLFYRAWEKSRFPIVYERTSGGQRSLFERALLSLMGLGSPTLHNRLAVDDRALLARAYAVGARGISALALAELVRDYFRVPARIEQFVPAWYQIESSELCRLGQQSCHLGEDVCLGTRARMAQSRFRVRLGPLTWPALAGFLPNGDAYRALVEICTLTTGPQFDFEFQLQLAPGHTPPLRLGVADEKGVPWLGWSTWLRGDPGEAMPAEVTIDGELVASDSAA
jgi:type VI secretion system protein ImpH